MNNLGVSFPFLVGPMVGISHVAFRELVRSYTPQGIDVLIFTEMLSTKRIPHEKLEDVEALRTGEEEQFFVPQLLGNDEKHIAPSIAKLLPLRPWGFDINMGCPATHILKHNWGVRLMGNPEYAADVVRIVKSHSPVPVSVKLRAGSEHPGTKSDENARAAGILSFTDHLEKAGADWMTVHARTSAQGHKGEADWALAAKIAKHRSLPIVANGDIQTAQDALSIVEEHGIDGAMFARAAVARPWVFWQLAEDLGITTSPTEHPGKKAPRTPQEEGHEFALAIIRLVSLLEQYFPQNEHYILERVDFYCATASPWLQFGHAFWKMTTKAKSVAQLKDLLHDFAEKYENTMTGRVKFL